MSRNLADSCSIRLEGRKHCAPLETLRGKGERARRHCTAVLLPVRVYVYTLPSCCSWEMQAPQ